MTKEEIKELRERLKMNQKEFAALIGVSKNTISNYENDGVIPESKFQLLGMIQKGLETEKAPEEKEPLLEEVNKKLDRALAYLVRLDLDSNDIKEGVSKTYEEVLKQK